MYSLEIVVCTLLLIQCNSIIGHFCHHGDNEINENFIHYVKLKTDAQRKSKRHSLENLKIYISYDSTLNNLPREKKNFVKNKVLPEAVSYWSQTLFVQNKFSTIKLLRQCKTDKVRYRDKQRQKKDGIHEEDLNAPYCYDGCTDETFCGDIRVPDHHLESCMQVSKEGAFELVGESGEGLNGVHFILYASSKNTKRCLVPDTVAYAAYCRLETSLDRPVAGYVNICPKEISTMSRDYHHMLYTIKHEILHALGFSSSLFAFYRDAQGNPLTPRSPATNKPHYNLKLKRFEWSDKVVRTVVKNDWRVGGRTFNRTLYYLVTPKVVEAVREHFGCASLIGAELEDQGSVGTSLTHWEKRLFENELMTGTFTQNLVVSNITLALLEDTGWYKVNYSMAGSLAWGRKLGCEFAEKSCSDWIHRQLEKNESVHPYCMQAKTSSSITYCSEDFTAVGICNLVQYENPLPLQYRNFKKLPGTIDPSHYGGTVLLADYCPYVQEFNWKDGDVVLRGSKCLLVENNPMPESNLLLESYGEESRCFEHPTPWTVDDCNDHHQVQSYGSACYKYACDHEKKIIGILIHNQLHWCSQNVVQSPKINYHFENSTGGHKHLVFESQPRRSQAVINVSVTSEYWLHRGTVKCPSFRDYCKESANSIDSTSSSLEDRYSVNVPCHSSSTSNYLLLLHQSLYFILFMCLYL